MGGPLPLVSTPSVAPPDAAGTMASHRAVRSWVRQWEISGEPAMIDPPGTAGACVTLRLGGVTLGRGVDLTGDGASVWRAARAAMLQAGERAPVDHDALRAENLREMAMRITVDVQTAGAPTPLPGLTFADAAALVNPGVEGVAARVGDRLRAVFPGTMLAANITPMQALMSAASEAGSVDGEELRVGVGPELEDFRTTRGLIVYRFAVTHLAQTSPVMEPVFLHRGGRVIQPADVTAERLAQSARHMALHLIERRARVTEGRDSGPGMLGDYQPWTGRYAPLLATPAQQGLAALALSRYAGMPGTTAADASRAARAVWQTLDDLAASAEDRSPAADAASAALYVSALLRAPATPPEITPAASLEHASAARAAETMRAAWSIESGWSAGLSTPARAVVAYGLALCGANDAAMGVTRATAEAAARSLLRDTPPGDVVSTLPWLGWACDALWPAQTAAGGAAPHVNVMLDTREMLWRHQLTYDDVGADGQDLIGGIVYTRGRQPLPTWQSARPLAYFAGALRDPRITTPEQRAQETARTLHSLRFLLQLQVSPYVVHMFREEERSIGGVREALWNQKITVDATSIALLALCEALDSAGTLARPDPARIEGASPPAPAGK